MTLRVIATAALLAAALPACVVDDEPALGEASSALDLAAFTLPAMSPAERAPIIRRYDALDPGDAVPRGLLEDAVLYFDINKPLIPKTRYLAIADMSLYSGKDRFWLVDLTTGAVEPHKVAHGDGTDPDNNGFADVFGNTDGSHMTSLGFYLSGEIYDGTHPHSMRLDGLTADGSPQDMANTNARDRLIVMHEASYVDDGKTTQQGRSNGCLALDPSIEVEMVDRIHDGSLIYAAKTPLSPPVGRAACGDAVCDGDEDVDTCAADCSTDVPDDGSESAGCSTGGSPAGLVLAFAMLGLRRRARCKLVLHGAKPR